MDEAMKLLAKVEVKEDKLTEDARVVRSLLKYTEGTRHDWAIAHSIHVCGSPLITESIGLDALKAHTKKEFNSENLRSE